MRTAVENLYFHGSGGYATESAYMFVHFLLATTIEEKKRVRSAKPLLVV